MALNGEKICLGSMKNSYRTILKTVTKEVHSKSMLTIQKKKDWKTCSKSVLQKKLCHTDKSSGPGTRSWANTRKSHQGDHVHTGSLVGAITQNRELRTNPKNVFEKEFLSW